LCWLDLNLEAQNEWLALISSQAKFEIRISNFETNSNIKNFNDKNKIILVMSTVPILFGSFEFWSLDIVSCFGFRAFALHRAEPLNLTYP